jgi:sialate O-acetylesterase
MIRFLRFAIAALPVLCANAAVTLSAVFTDHMVVQRGLPVHVWGRADAGEAVSVAFRGETRAATADELGNWSVYLPPGDAGGPFELTVRGSNAITLTDVLVGDVWVASGQSNMEFPLKNAVNGAAEVAGANHPRIRLFLVKRRAEVYPATDVEAKPWAVCTPESAADFSAVAYFFARQIEDTQHVPIGLIESNWGGTPADTWTRLAAIAADAGLMPVIAEWANMTEEHAGVEQKREREYQDRLARARAEGKPAPERPWAANTQNEWMPAGLWNGMIAPLTPAAIRGVIWYQGESNASVERAPLYARLFQTMITDWRRAWAEGDFPFLYVQLANFKTNGGPGWPELREAQLQTLSLANTGMAVTIDIGTPDDIHPKDKQDVGRRLALAARAIAYGEKIEYSGPLFRAARPENGAMRIWFDHAESGLVAHGGGALRGFEIAGADGHFVPAEARIDGATVVVSSRDVAKPAAVRYAWADNPDCNLFNGAGLPASPFRSAP